MSASAREVELGHRARQDVLRRLLTLVHRVSPPGQRDLVLREVAKVRAAAARNGGVLPGGAE